MRKVLLAALPICMLFVAAVSSHAAVPYLNAKPITGAWTLNISNVGDVWTWDVTLNAVTGYYGGTIQDAQGFTVYDDDEYTDADSELGWSLGALNNGAAVEWKRTRQQAYLLTGAANKKWFEATIPNLDDPMKVVFHVREVDAAGNVTTYFAREGERENITTPELSTWMLLGVSGLGGLFLRRRRKS